MSYIKVPGREISGELVRGESVSSKTLEKPHASEGRPAHPLSAAFLRVWNSPTAMSWTSQLASMSRLLIVTPLILTRFDRTEIACWFLFGSLNVFGSLVSNRLGVTFSRMIAFACGGAEDLSPIRKAGEKRGNGQPNWPMVVETYATLGSLQGLLGILAALVAWGMGLFGLSNLLAGYPNPQRIMEAFAVFVLSTGISFAYQKYFVALVGLNKVALANRIDTVFSVLSVAAGVVTLSAGGGILVLAFVMQIFPLVGLLRNRWLLRKVGGSHFLHAPACAWNKKILVWAWEPTWKSMAGKIANTGLIQASGIIFAKYGTSEQVASYLLANRVLTVAAGIAVTPFFSRIPVFARWLGEGNMDRLQKEVPRRIATASLLLGGAILAVGVLVQPLLFWIGSKVVFLPLGIWLLIGGGMLIVNFGQLNASATAIGNHVVLYREQFATSVVSLGLMLWLTPMLGLPGLLLGMYLPLVGFLTCRSILVGSSYLGLNPWEFFRRSFLPVFGGYFLLAVVAFLFLQ